MERRVGEDDRGFSGAWQTLVRTGLDPAATGSATLTPSNYIPREDDDLALPEPAPFDLTLLDHLPEFRVEGDRSDLVMGVTLGRGGMAEVRSAHQRSLDRDIAIKRLHDLQPAHIQALLREARLLGQLGHPNIISVHALACDEDGVPMLLMKQIHGQRWSDQILAAGVPGRLGSAVLDRHLEILRDVSKAVQFAHSKGIVHRDIKPGNVLVGEYGEVVLVDWGIAAKVGEVAAGMALGTPAYMAPEMVVGAPAAPHNDIFLLGATLHRLLTGRARHQGSSIEQTLYAAHASEPVLYEADVPADLAMIANRATSLAAEDRYASVEDFLRALDQFEEHRASRQLAQASMVRAAVYAERCDEPTSRQLEEIGHQARFGFLQALEAWDGNAQARDELVSHLERQISVALANEDADGAVSLLEQFVRWGGKRGDLGERVDRLARRAKALAKLGKELDLSVRAGWRLAYLGFYTLSAFLLGGAAVMAIRMEWLALDHRVGLVASVLAAVTLLAVVLIGRKALLATVANQRVAFTLVVTAWGVAVHRTVAFALDVPLHATMTVDIVLLGLASAVAAVSLDVRLLAVTALLVAMAFTAAALPAVAFEIATLSLGVVGVVLVGLYAPWVRR